MYSGSGSESGSLLKVALTLVEVSVYYRVLYLCVYLGGGYKNYGPVRTPGLKEQTRSVSWPNVVKGD